MTAIQAPPIREPAVDGSFFFTRAWRNFLLTLQTVGQSSPQILIEKSLQAQTAALVTTPLDLPKISAGYYRISVTELLTVAALTSSSLQVTIGWTDGAAPRSRILPALTGNTVGENDAVSFPIHVDDNSPITYAAAYASNGANQMTYNLGVIAEALA